MKGKNKILACILSLVLICFEGKNLKSGFSFASAPSYEYNNEAFELIEPCHTNVCEEDLKIDGFSIKKIFKKNNKKFLYYEHDKTGAQIVIMLNYNYRDYFEIGFRSPLEDDSGANHVLEHCILHPMIIADVDVHGETNCGIVRFYQDQYDESVLKLLLYQLREPDFKNEPEIVRSESAYIHKDSFGNKVIRGRAFKEQLTMGDSLFQSEIKTSNSFMCANNKMKFNVGGVPDKILGLSHEKICELHDKLIHPSNSLTYITGTHWQQILNTLQNEYLNYFTKKSVDICFDLEPKIEPSDYSLYKSKRLEDFDYCDEYLFSGSAQYKAMIGYGFSNLTDKEQDQFRVIAEAINRKRMMFYQKLKQKGYANISAKIIIDQCPHLRIDLYGDNKEFFDKNYLLSSVNDLMHDILNEKFVVLKRWCDNYTTYRGLPIYDISYISFVLYNEPFSEMIFTIENDEIKARDLDYIYIDKDIVTEKIKHPQEIMVLEKDEDSVYLKNEKYTFAIPKGLSDNKTNNWLALVSLNHYVISPYILKKGITYDRLAVNPEGDGFVTRELSSIDDLEMFFNYNFFDLASDFKMTDEMLNIIKKKCLTYIKDFDDRQQIEAAHLEDIQEIIKNILE